MREGVDMELSIFLVYLCKKYHVQQRYLHRTEMYLLFMYIEDSVICNRVIFFLSPQQKLEPCFYLANKIVTILSRFQIQSPLHSFNIISNADSRLNLMTRKSQYIILQFKIALFCLVTSCLCGIISMTKKQLKVSLIADIEIGFPHNVNRSRYQNFTKVKASYSLLSLEIYFMSNIQVSLQSSQCKIRAYLLDAKQLGQVFHTVKR